MTRLTLLTHGFATAAPTGVGRYATEVVRSLAVAAPADWELRLTTSFERPLPTPPDRVGLRQLPRPRKLLHAALAGGFPRRWDRRLDRPDVVHQLNAWVPVPTVAPQVVTIHDLMPVLQPQWFSRGHRWRFRRALEHAVRRGSTIVCDSRYVADLVADELGVPDDRLHVVHLGVSDAFRRPVAAADVERVCGTLGLEPGGYLLGLGVMSAREDPSTIITALADVTVELGPTSLVLTGPDRHGGAEIRERARRAGVLDRLLFAGFVDDADLVPLLAGAAALVHPSRDEGFGLTPLEAMAVGTPVISSRAGSLPEIVGDAAVSVDPDDIEAWAAAIDAVVGDQALRDALVAKGAAHQATFTWQRAADELLGVYRETIDAAT